MGRVRVTVLLAALCAAAACGGVSEEEFAERADEQCRRTQSELRADSSARGTDRVLQIATAFEREATELERLEPPAGRSEDVAKLAGAIRDQADILRGIAARAPSDPADDATDELARVLREGGRASAESRRLGARLGLRVCGRA